ncbi:MAG: DEAD/DEAH box helicase, partial [Thermoproteota archaeon]
MDLKLDELRDAYHKIVKFEYLKYKETNKLQQVFFTLSEIQEKEGISQELIKELENLGFVVAIGNDTYRSIIMDIAFRASDIRIKYGGTKYVLESDLALKERPLLGLDYVKFDRPDKNLEELKKASQTVIPEDFADRFFRALNSAGIKGLSKYQFDSIMKLLYKKDDVVVSAPTAFGKTYIFIIPILLVAIKAKLEGREGTVAVIFYPRKSLGSDQMGRLIKIIYHVNKECNLHISVGIDDGDVRYRKDLKDFDKYRGIKCPLHSEETLIIKQKKVFCSKCNNSFDFIRLTREDFENDPPTILITNVWAYQYKLTNPRYWKNGYLSPNIEYFVFDEIHAYRSIVAGILRYFIQTLRSLVSNKARFILSSATIPKVDEFIQDITGKSIEHFLKLIYDEKIHGKDAEKIELYLLVGINPLTSWETYTHELAIFLSTINRIRKSKNLQSLIFVDGIRNISRLYTQTLEAIELGDPKDHLLSYVPPSSPFCYWVYNENYKISEQEVNKISELQNEIKNKIETHYSDKADRFEMDEKIKEGNIDVVFTTSTLELGVDYDKVSIIVNTGIPFSLESITQRVGRAGRDEKSTLNTSLSIIVVRNNPLEYFYLFEGVDKLTEVENLPKIPVSLSNLFVVLYSMLIYAATYLTKNGKNLMKKDNEEAIKTLESITQYVSEHKSEIIEKVNVKVNASEIEKELSEIRKVVQLLKEPDISEKLKKIKTYKEVESELNELKHDVLELKNQLEPIKEEISKLSETDKSRLEKICKSIERDLDTLEKCNLNNISNMLEVLHNVAISVDEVKNYPKSQAHSLFKFVHDLNEYSYKLGKHRERLGELANEKYEIEEGENFLLYFKANEVYEKLSENIINLIEAIIGFKFMGNEFIDQSLHVGVEFQSFEDKKEMFFSDVISRIPPFELVTVPYEDKEQKDITKAVGARHFWLVKPKVGFFIEPKKYYKEIDEKYLLGGETEKIEDLGIPQEINLVDLLSLEEPIQVKMRSKDNKNIFIKYGSEKVTKRRIDGRFDLFNNIKRLYSHDKKNFEYIKDRTLKELEYVHKTLQKGGNKWGLNFRYPSICHLGYCISTDPFDEECPVKERCKLCDGKKFWSASKRKIFPKFFLNLKVRKLPKVNEPLLFQLGAKTYDQLKEHIEFIYDSTTVYLPTSFRDYMLREIELTPIGYLARTSLIYLRFNNTLMNLFISKAVSEDPQLLEILKFKYFMFNILQKNKLSSLDAAMQYKKYSSSKIDVNGKDFHNFVERCLVHSLAHLFFLFLVKGTQVDPEKITYFIGDESTIYILENSKNDGMGLVETIKSAIENNGERKLIEDFVDYSQNFLLKHEEHVKIDQDLLKEEAQEFLERLTSVSTPILNKNKIIELQKKIKELNSSI